MSLFDAFKNKMNSISITSRSTDYFVYNPDVKRTPELELREQRVAEVMINERLSEDDARIEVLKRYYRQEYEQYLIDKANGKEGIEL